MQHVLAGKLKWFSVFPTFRRSTVNDRSIDLFYLKKSGLCSENFRILENHYLSNLMSDGPARHYIFRINAKNLSLTFTKCNQSKEVTMTKLRALFPSTLKYAIICQEHHEDGDLHLHLAIQAIGKFNIQTADFQSFNNLANKGRFRVLMDRTYSLNYTSMASDGAAVVSQAATTMHDSFFKKCNIPIEFDSTAGAITEIKSNNIGVLMIGQDSGDASTFFSKMRLRFVD